MFQIIRNKTVRKTLQSVIAQSMDYYRMQCAVADPENFGGGIIKILSTKPHKAQKFKGFFRPKSGGLQKKRSSPKLRLISRPKSEIQRFFPPTIR